MTKDEILASLPVLNRSDLEAVAAIATSLLNGRTANVATKASPLAAPLFDALCGAVSATAALSNLSGTSTGKTFEKHLPGVTKFLDHHFKGWSDNKLVQLAFLGMLAELLRDDLKERGVTPTLGILVSNLGRLPEVFDNAYPNYLACGMGNVILKHFEKMKPDVVETNTRIQQVRSVRKRSSKASPD